MVEGKMVEMLRGSPSDGQAPRLETVLGSIARSRKPQLLLGLLLATPSSSPTLSFSSLSHSPFLFPVLSSSGSSSFHLLSRSVTSFTSLHVLQHFLFLSPFYHTGTQQGMITDSTPAV